MTVLIQLCPARTPANICYFGYFQELVIQLFSNPVALLKGRKELPNLVNTTRAITRRPVEVITTGIRNLKIVDRDFLYQIFSFCTRILPPLSSRESCFFVVSI